MVDTGYLYSKDKSRIFINICLGCRADCSYCYLPKINYSNKDITRDNVAEAKDLIDQIEQEDLVNKKTLISLGCFSECWDDNNKSETTKLIEYFLKKGNQIQLATKKEIQPQELQEISKLIQYLGQLTIFVSSSTLSKWSEIEKDTDRPDKRFKTFQVSKELAIPTVLYMKPVLQGITIQDIELYKKLIDGYEIKDVVVGSMFGQEHTEEKVFFSDKNELFYNQTDDESTIIEILQGKCDVFTRSSQVMNKYRQKQIELGEK